MSEWELIHDEAGDVEITMLTMMVKTCFGLVCIYPGFISDLDTFVPNLPDHRPPIVHDFLYKHGIFQDGRIVKRWQADIIYGQLSVFSWSKLRKASALWRTPALMAGGWMRWYSEKAPIPTKHAHLYQATPFNKAPECA